MRSIWLGNIAQTVKFEEQTSTGYHRNKAARDTFYNKIEKHCSPVELFILKFFCFRELQSSISRLYFMNFEYRDPLRNAFHQSTNTRPHPLFTASIKGTSSVFSPRRVQKRLQVQSQKRAIGEPITMDDCGNRNEDTGYPVACK